MFTYKVKTINPMRKRDVVVRQLHHFTGKFESVVAVHTKPMEELKEQVPNTINFNVGTMKANDRPKSLLHQRRI